MSYFENFVGFKNRNSEESVASATQGYDSYQRFGDDPDGGGTEKFDSEGNSIGVGTQRGNARTRRWGDTEGYQVGNTYTKLEGDAVVDVVGNSSAKRTGWVNNVTFGPTFATQIGGTFATSLFAVNTMLGFRCSIFVGLDASINAAAAVRVVKGANYTIGIAKEYGLKEQKTEALNEKTEIVAAVQRIIGEENSIVVSNDMIVAKKNSLTCLSSEVIAVEYQVFAANAEIVGTLSTKITSTGDLTVNGAKVTMNGAVISMGAALLKLG